MDKEEMFDDDDAVSFDSGMRSERSNASHYKENPVIPTRIHLKMLEKRCRLNSFD